MGERVNNEEDDDARCVETDGRTLQYRTDDYHLKQNCAAVIY